MILVSQGKIRVDVNNINSHYGPYSRNCSTVCACIICNTVASVKVNYILLRVVKI